MHFYEISRESAKNVQFCENSQKFFFSHWLLLQTRNWGTYDGVCWNLVFAISSVCIISRWPTVLHQRPNSQTLTGEIKLTMGLPCRLVRQRAGVRQPYAIVVNAVPPVKDYDLAKKQHISFWKDNALNSLHGRCSTATALQFKKKV